MITVEELRTALRISNDVLDKEISDTLDAAILDLGTAGVETGAGDALIVQAIKLYARWQFDFCGQGERYRSAYESMKACLPLVEEYREERDV